jgi:hypothetical protein
LATRAKLGKIERGSLQRCGDPLFLFATVVQREPQKRQIDSRESSATKKLSTGGVDNFTGY